MSVDRLQTCVPIRNGDIGEVYVHRIAAQIPMEKIYGSPAMHGEIRYSEHQRHYSDQECHLTAVCLIHNH